MIRTVEADGRRRAFGPADERPYRRLTGDWVRLVLATALVVATAVNATDDGATERSIDGFFHSLPGALDGFFRAALAVGSVWGVALVFGAALVARRVRLAVVLVVAGLGAWWCARFVGFLVAGRSVGGAFTAVFGGGSPGQYPAVHLAVIGAVVLVAAPFLIRPVRRLGQLVLLVVAPGVIILGVGGAIAVLGALGIAWGIAAALHLAFGSPAGRPTTAQVAAALGEMGVVTERVELDPVQVRGSTLVDARLDDGRDLRVRVYGRDAADTRLVAKAWRFVAYKDWGPSLTFTRLQQVEHEALCLLDARQAGVRVPAVVVAGVAGPSAALLALDEPGDPRLADLPDGTDPSDLAAVDAGCRSVWDAVGRLHAARIAHGALDAEHIRVGPAGATLVDFDASSVFAIGSELDRDVAQALVTTALLVGPERAVELACDAVGVDALATAQRYVTKPALTPSSRRGLRADKELLDRLGTSIAAVTGAELVQPVELRRVKPLNLVMFAALLFAVWVILGQIGSVRELVDTLQTADWPWVLLGFVLAQTTAVAFAAATIGSVAQLIPLIPATALQMAISFTNMVAPSSAASTIMNIRFLQKQGVELGAATSSGVLVGLSGTITQFALFVVTAFAVGQEASLSQVGGGGTDGRLLVAIVLGVAVAVGIVLAVPRIRRFGREKVWPEVVAGVRNVWGILTTPRQLALVLGGSVAAQLLYSLCLLSCLKAYGGSLSFGEIVFVNTSASFLASLVPVPGGIGVAEAAMVAGLTAFGIPPETATAAVITHRLFTTYLPPIWGNYAMKWLIGAGYL
jgi:glycosyltransferase 2 family protein